MGQNATNVDGEFFFRDTNGNKLPALWNLLMPTTQLANTTHPQHF